METAQPANSQSQLHSPPPVLTKPNAAEDERLGSLRGDYAVVEDARLSPREIAEIELACAEDARHLARLNEARDNAFRSDAAILARRDAAILAALQRDREADYATQLLKLGGTQSRYPLLRELAELAYASGPTQAPLALASALVTVAALVSPSTRIRVGSHTLPVNLLIASPASSGSGKNAALAMLRGVLAETGRGGSVVEKITSPQALEDALAEVGEICLLQDEFGAPAGGGAKSSPPRHCHRLLQPLGHAGANAQEGGREA